jgi:hypothetical protein
MCSVHERVLHSLILPFMDQFRPELDRVLLLLWLFCLLAD